MTQIEQKEYETLVYIGRFQPFHNAHLKIIQKALDKADQVIVIVGSADQPRTYKNPFTFEERKRMILRSMAEDISGSVLSRVKIFKNVDSIYNDQGWSSRIQKIVKENTEKNHKIGIIGHDKDESSYYLKMFPQWQREEVDLIEPLNATDVRELIFKEDFNMNFILSVVPEPVVDFINQFTNTGDFKQIIREREFINLYKKQYEHLPYAPVFVTVDAVVVQSGHVLMIKRRSEPGKGLWALPGGFLDAEKDKSVELAMIRELKEETKIKVPAPVLRGSVKDSKVFDAIGRSARGRTITHAFKIVLPDGELPRVRGSDDAEIAKWIPLSDLDPKICFEDHFEIISYFIGDLSK